MALTSAIPLPQSGMEAFDSSAANSQSIIDSLMRNKLVQPEIDLKKAEAAKSGMLARLISQVMGGGSSGGGSGGMGGSQADLAAALLGIPVTNQVIDGKLVRNNPFTGMTMQQVGETPQNKRDADSAAQVGVADAKTKNENALKIEDAASELKNTYSLYNDLNKLLIKRPSLTGIGTGILSSRRFSNDPDVAAFKEKSAKLQAALAKLGSQRGGIYALNWAEAGKPHIANSAKYNKGMIGSGMEDIKHEMDNLRNRYQHLTGKDFNFQLEDPEENEMPSNAPSSMPNNAGSPEANGAEALQVPQDNQPAQPKLNGGQVILYKNGKEYHLPPNLMQRALKEGFSLGN